MMDEQMNEQKNELSVLIKYRSRMIWFGILAVVVIAVLAIIFIQGSRIKNMRSKIEELSDQTAVYTSVTKEVTIAFIESEIKDIGELATIEYLYTNAGKFEDPKQLFGKDVPFTTKSFIAKWDGTIKAGINVEKIITEVNDANKEIIIYMPKAEILSHEIMDESIETLDEKDGLFNPVKVDDVRNFDAISKEVMEKRVIENGLLDKAYENAENIIEKLINNDVVQEQGYIIKFEVIE